jgi:hypothetical protein
VTANHKTAVRFRHGAFDTLYHIIYFLGGNMKKIIFLILMIIIVFSGCKGDAVVVSQNLSTDADMFRINRRVVFYNGITGDYMLVIEGLISIEADGLDHQLEVTCKTGDNQYKKHFLGLSDNVTYFVEQIDSANSDPYHYKVIFKPSTIIPDIEVK